MNRAKQFETFRASELLCPGCRTLRPVRERLMLALPRGELFEYRCRVCGEHVGTREATTAPSPLILPR